MDIKPASRSIVLSYPEIICPLKEVLELENASTVDLVCGDVLEEVLKEVSKEVEKQYLEDLLMPMQDRPVYHHLEVIDGGTTKVTDFLSDLDLHKANIYASNVVLAESSPELCYLTQGQSCNVRYV